MSSILTSAFAPFSRWNSRSPSSASDMRDAVHGGHLTPPPEPETSHLAMPS
jgi:hypothetical protein